MVTTRQIELSCSNNGVVSFSLCYSKSKASINSIGKHKYLLSEEWPLQTPWSSEAFWYFCNNIPSYLLILGPSVLYPIGTEPVSTELRSTDWVRAHQWFAYHPLKVSTSSEFYFRFWTQMIGWIRRPNMPPWSSLLPWSWWWPTLMRC